MDMDKNSSKVRLYALAKQLKVDARRLIEEVRSHGAKVSVPSNSISKELADVIRSAHSSVINNAVADGSATVQTTEPSSPIVQVERGSISDTRGLYKTTWKGPHPRLSGKDSDGYMPRAGSAIPHAIDSYSEMGNSEPKLRTGKRMKVCPICTASFESKRTLSTHFKEGHSLEEKKRVTQPLKLVYTPPQASSFSGGLSTSSAKRKCPLCSRECKSKGALRTHIATDHIDDVIAARITCDIKLTELAAALNVDHKAVENAAKRIGANVNNDSFVPANFVGDLVRQLRLSFPHPKASHQAPIRKSNTVNSKAADHCDNYGQLSNISADTYDKLQCKDFGELRRLIDDCLKGRAVGPEDQPLLTSDPAMLWEYALILESKVSSSPSNRLSVRIVKRIFEDIRIYEKQGPRFNATKMKWRLLPRGTHPFQRIVKHFQALSKQRAEVVYDIDRLHKAHSLGPDEVFVGTEEFEGYVVFYFRLAATAVLDCPVFGNAIYVFGEDWKSLSRLTKSELLNARRNNVERIIHSGDWFPRLRSLVATRRLNAHLR